MIDVISGFHVCIYVLLLLLILYLLRYNLSQQGISGGQPYIKHYPK